MDSRKVFRVTVLGSPQAEQWLLARAFAESEKRPWSYELAADAASQAPHMFVIDPESSGALVRWMALDRKGSLPAVFLGSVSQRAKFAVITARPFTSGRIVDSLDQLARRIAAFPDPGVPANAGQARSLPAPALA